MQPVNLEDVRKSEERAQYVIYKQAMGSLPQEYKTLFEQVIEFRYQN